ncbi:hypothetical protein LIER_41925 [Lithospermum erythrorhizon]|uniref:Gag-pol polyprotein n=1 Tax=Lithospermum erythrorhizon TaxID=34254 RepID=A0AAV3RI46_LITER
MEGIKEGGSISHPPLLDRINYLYWKAKLIAFLKFVDTKTWKVVLTGWSTPTITHNNGTIVKAEFVQGG